MKSEAPQVRRKPNFRSLLEELKFLKSLADLKYFFQKVSYVWPRLIGTVDRWRDVPPSIQIEPTLYCNLDCITCGRSKSTRKPGTMDFALFRKIIDDASQIGVKRILLFLYGESLLHPQIVEMIRYIKSKGLAFHLTTNGALLTDALGEAILRAGVTSADYLTVSILGFSKEVHEKVMRGIDHEQVVQNLHHFIEARDRLGVNGPVIEAVSYAIPENQHEVAPLLDYWEKFADHVIDGGQAVQAFIDQGLPTVPRTRRCTQLWERMAVYWNGDVAICGEDLNGDFLVGNLRESTIKEVWTGEALRRLQKLHKEGKFDQIPICKYCDW